MIWVIGKEVHFIQEYQGERKENFGVKEDLQVWNLFLRKQFADSKYAENGRDEYNDAVVDERGKEIVPKVITCAWADVVLAVIEEKQKIDVEVSEQLQGWCQWGKLLLKQEDVNDDLVDVYELHSSHLVQDRLKQEDEQNDAKTNIQPGRLW